MANYTGADKVTGNTLSAGDWNAMKSAVNSKPDTASASWADYVIEKTGSTYYAHPGQSSGLPLLSNADAYTVIQGAIDNLTPAGAVGSGGGEISIAIRGNIFLSNELVINGWEGNGAVPYSQLRIYGKGFATKLNQVTSGKNAIVVKNRASVSITDLYIGANANSKACILFDSTGANSEVSTERSFMNNLMLNSVSTTTPALVMKNFFDVTVPSINVQNPFNSAIELINNSTTVDYGNSHFGFVRAAASTSAPYAGLVLRSTNTANAINLLTFANYECILGNYGIYAEYARYCKFGFVDLENMPKPIYFAPGGLVRSLTFDAGLVLPSVGGTAITCAATSGANTFNNLFLSGRGDTSFVAITDASVNQPPNSYDVQLEFGVNPALITIANPNTRLIYRSTQDFKTHSKGTITID